MHSAEITVGRQLLVVLDPGDEVLASVAGVARAHGIRQGYLPVFLGAFADMDLIGTCRAVPDPDVPLADLVQVEGVEGSGCGTVAWDAEHDRPTVHLHAAVGVKRYAATGFAGHVLRAHVQYTAELVLVEVVSPPLRRVAGSGVPFIEIGGQTP